MAKKTEGVINKAIKLFLKILIVLFWIIIFLSIFFPNSIDYWLPHSQVWEEQGWGVR